jgi:hypothetical protein
MHIRVTLGPAVVLGFMGFEIVENDMELCVWTTGHKLVHKLEKLDASAVLLVGSLDHLACRHFQRCKQRRGAVPLVS